MMKSTSRSGLLCLVASSMAILVACLPATAQSDYEQPGDAPSGYDQPIRDVSTADFEERLAPHGRWVDTAEYGRVWIPNVGRDFQPYATNGHWVVTQYGNTWVSDYEWGWAAFHYGRWYRDDRFGWAWVPGQVWGPSWVSWRSGDGYYGWAPLSPRVSINVNIPLDFWTFVPQAYITSPQLYSYYIPRPRIVNIYRNTTVVNNFYRANNRNYVYGPRRQEIERVTRSRVDVRSIDRLNQPGRSVVTGRAVKIYLPETAGNQQRRNDGIPGRFNNPANNNRQSGGRSGIFDRQPTPPVVGETPPARNNQQSGGRSGIFNRQPTPPVVGETPPARNNQQSGGRSGFFNRQSPPPVVGETPPARNNQQSGGRSGFFNRQSPPPRSEDTRPSEDPQQQPNGQQRSGGRGGRPR
jgi:hypothetical protein